MRGRAPLTECCFCGRRQPRDKMVRFTKYPFSFYDERMGLQYRGIPETRHACPSCGRHRSIKDERPRKGRPKFR
jgi:transposase-like protein